VVFKWVGGITEDHPILESHQQVLIASAPDPYTGIGGSHYFETVFDTFQRERPPDEQKND
jgi:hypothetical protein